MITISSEKPEALRQPRCYGSMPEEAALLKNQLERRPTPLVNDLLDLTIAIAYFDLLLANSRVKRYLNKNHQLTLSRLEKFIEEVKAMRTESETGTMNVWSVARAQKDLKQIIHLSRTVGPQMISSYRRASVVVVSVPRWKAIMRRFPQLEDLFWKSRLNSRVPETDDDKAKLHMWLLAKKRGQKRKPAGASKRDQAAQCAS